MHSFIYQLDEIWRIADFLHRNTSLTVSSLLRGPSKWPVFHVYVVVLYRRPFPHKHCIWELELSRAHTPRVWHAKRNKNKDVISRLPDVILQLPAVIIRLSQKSLFYVLKSQRCFQTPESGHGMWMWYRGAAPGTYGTKVERIWRVTWNHMGVANGARIWGAACGAWPL